MRMFPRFAVLLTCVVAIAVVSTLPSASSQKPAGKEPRVDGEGSPLPPGAVARLGSLKFRHAWWIHAVAFAPDGKTVVSGAQWSPMYFWDRASGRPVRKVKTTFENVVAIAFSPDGKSLGVASHKDSIGGQREKWTIELRDAATGKLQTSFALTGENKVAAVGFSSKGELLCARFEDKLIHVINVKKKQPQLPPLRHQAKARIVRFSRHDKTIIIADEDNLFYFWDAATGKELRRLHLKNEPVSKSGGAVAQSPDGRMLAVATSDTRLRFYDAKSGKQLRECKQNNISALDFSRDGNTVAAAGRYGFLRFWDVKTGKEINPPTRHTEYPTAVAISPNGRLVATAGRENTVRLWDAQSGRPAGVFTYLIAPDDLIFSPDNKVVIFGGSGGTRQLKAWSAKDGKIVKSFANQKNEAGQLTFSSNRKKLLARRRYEKSTIFEWDAVNGQLLKIHTNASPLLWWELQHGKKLQYDGWLKETESKMQTISPDGRLIATTDGSMQSVDLRHRRTGNSLRRITTNGLDFGGYDSRKFRFTPDGKTLIMVNYNAGIVRLMSDGERDPFSPILLFEAATGREWTRLRGHHHHTASFDLTSDGRFLTTIGYDHTALVWDLHNLTGIKKKSLTQQEANALWTELANPIASKAYRAIEALTAAPKQAIPLLKKHLRPISKPDSGKINLWIKDLDSENFRIREKARFQLAKTGESAEPYLRAALKKPLSLEMGLRLEKLIKKLDDEWKTPAPERIRYIRALMVLERIATPDAQRILATLAGGLPGTRTTREAAETLARLRDLR